MFKSVEAFGSLWFTGKAIYEIDLLSPIKHCQDLGYRDKDIVIDVILSGNPHLSHAMAQYYTSLQVMERSFEIQKYYQSVYGLLRASAGHQDVQFRHVIGPSREMPSKVVPVKFTRDEVLK